MSLKTNKLAMAGAGVAACITLLSAIGCAKPQSSPAYYSTAIVHEYLASTEINVLELRAITGVLKEMQTVPTERISGNSWSYNYILIGEIDEAHQGKLASLARHSAIIWKPGYLVVSYSDFPNRSDTDLKKVTLEEVANAAYGVGPDKVAAALGFAIDREARDLKPSLSTMYVALK